MATVYTTCLTSLELLPVFSSSTSVESLSTLHVRANLWMLDILLKIILAAFLASTRTVTGETFLKCRARLKLLTKELRSTYDTDLLFMTPDFCCSNCQFGMEIRIALRTASITMLTSLELAKSLSLPLGQRLPARWLFAQSLANW